MPKNHYYIYLTFVLLAIPLYFLDRYYLRSGSWPNFHGLLIIPYMVLLITYICINSISIWLFSHPNLAFMHVRSGILSVVLILACAFVYYCTMEFREFMETKERRALRDVINLRAWWFEQDESQVYLEVSVTKSGRFSADAEGYLRTELKDTLLFRTGAEGAEQIQVEAGQNFIFPLVLPGEPHMKSSSEIKITLYLYEVSGSRQSIIKIYLRYNYMRYDYIEYDGQYYYEVLPPPLKMF